LITISLDRGTALFGKLLKKTLLSAAILAVTATGSFADYKEQLSGRTIDVMVGFSNSGSGARFWNLFSDHMRRLAPDTRVRAEFKDGPLTAVGLEELYETQEGGLALGLIRPPELAFKQILRPEEVNVNLRDAHWLLSVENISFIMAGKRDLFEDVAELQNPDEAFLLPVNDPLATATVVSVLLSAVTNTPTRTVVGFGRSDRTKALVAGDVDLLTLGVEPSIVALIESGDIVPIYKIVGDDFTVVEDAIPDLSAFVADEVDPGVVAFIRSARGMGRAFFAPPGVTPEDVVAMQELLEAVVTDPDFIQEAQLNGVPIAALSGDILTQQIGALVPDAEVARASILATYECGLAMALDTEHSCDF
jgi:tripartite-type tricarboxylate transporter receptor subunit TctC